MRAYEFINENIVAKNKMNKIYDLMISTIGSGPYDGGCVTMAMAIQMGIGGELYVLTGTTNKHSNLDQAQHAVVYLDDHKMADASGIHSIESMISLFQKNELSPHGGKCTGYRVLAENDLLEAPRNVKLANEIAKILFNGRK